MAAQIRIEGKAVQAVLMPVMPSQRPDRRQDQISSGGEVPEHHQSVIGLCIEGKRAGDMRQQELQDLSQGQIGLGKMEQIVHPRRDDHPQIILPAEVLRLLLPRLLLEKQEECPVEDQYPAVRK